MHKIAFCKSWPPKFYRLHFSEEHTSFHGPGWNQIIEEVGGVQPVPICEDHFANEIPAFTQAVADLRHSDNFIIELDPYSIERIERSLEKYSAIEREGFNKKILLFLCPESRMQTTGKYGIGRYQSVGAEQIVKYADQLVLQELADITSSQKAGHIYRQMMDSSGYHFKRFQ